MADSRLHSRGFGIDFLLSPFVIDVSLSLALSHSLPLNRFAFQCLVVLTIRSRHMKVESETSDPDVSSVKIDRPNFDYVVNTIITTGFRLVSEQN